MNMMPEKRNVSMVDIKLAVRPALRRDTNNTRLERSPGENVLIKVAGRSSRRDIMAVCRAYSTLSLMRITTRLRAVCTIISPMLAPKSKVATGKIWKASPDGIISEKISLQTCGENMVSRMTPIQAKRP